MIVSCINCNKKFEIDAALIPDNGRLLQCNNCNHKWFFKNESIAKSIEPTPNDDLNIFESTEVKKKKNSDFDDNENINDKINPSLEETVDKIRINNNENLRNYNFLNLIIVFIISFVALVILTDTFMHPIKKIFPNIEFLLYNLYEAIKDITLFIKDLI